jgi:hypothetical protein
VPYLLAQDLLDAGDRIVEGLGHGARCDVTGFEPWQWFVWQADGTYVPQQIRFVAAS